MKTVKRKTKNEKRELEKKKTSQLVEVWIGITSKSNQRTEKKRKEEKTENKN